MEECNSTSSQIIVPICIVQSVCVANTIFLAFIISWTPSLRGFSGVLLLNELVASFIRHVSSIATLNGNNLTTMGVSTIHKIAHVLKRSAHSVTMCLLFVINVNLCLAVCKGAAYKRLVTWKRVAVITITIWILCFLVGFLPYSNDNFVLDCETKLLIPIPNGATGLRTLGYLLASAFIIIGSIVILLKVRYQRTRVQPDYTLRSATETAKKMKLMRLAFVMTMIQAAAFTYRQLIPYSYNSKELRKALVPVNIIMFILAKIYDCFRVCFYLALYTPMWETTKSLLPCRRRNGIRNRTVVSSVHQGQSQQHNVRPDWRDTSGNSITPAQLPGDTPNRVIASTHTSGDEHSRGIISVLPTREVSQIGLMLVPSRNTSMKNGGQAHPQTPIQTISLSQSTLQTSQENYEMASIHPAETTTNCV